MATITLSRLRVEALMLPEAERAELAHELVKSLDADAHVAAEWDREILRRLDQAEAGTANLWDGAAIRRRMRARLGKP